MYQDYEGAASFHLALKGAMAIAVIFGAIYLVTYFVGKLRERKLEFRVIDILKLVWLVGSISVCIFLASLFFPKFSVDEWNRKFTDYLPFKRGLLGVFTSSIVIILVTIFCIGGIVTYFEKPKDKRKDN